MPSTWGSTWQELEPGWHLGLPCGLHTKAMRVCARLGEQCWHTSGAGGAVAGGSSGASSSAEPRASCSHVTVQVLPTSWGNGTALDRRLALGTPF